MYLNYVQGSIHRREKLSNNCMKEMFLLKPIAPSYLQSYGEQDNPVLATLCSWHNCTTYSYVFWKENCFLGSLSCYSNQVEVPAPYSRAQDGPCIPKRQAAAQGPGKWLWYSRRGFISAPERFVINKSKDEWTVLKLMCRWCWDPSVMTALLVHSGQQEWGFWRAEASVLNILVLFCFNLKEVRRSQGSLLGLNSQC